MIIRYDCKKQILGEEWFEKTVLIDLKKVVSVDSNKTLRKISGEKLVEQGNITIYLNDSVYHSVSFDTFAEFEEFRQRLEDCMIRSHNENGTSTISSFEDITTSVVKKTGKNKVVFTETAI